MWKMLNFRKPIDYLLSSLCQIYMVVDTLNVLDTLDTLDALDTLDITLEIETLHKFRTAWNQSQHVEIWSII